MTEWLGEGLQNLLREFKSHHALIHVAEAKVDKRKIVALVIVGSNPTCHLIMLGSLVWPKATVC